MKNEGKNITADTEKITSSASSEPCLYLFPVPLSTGDVHASLPQANIDLIKEVKYFVVENIRSARRVLKQCDRAINIDELDFVELNEHTPLTDVEAMLRPMAEGHSIGVISEAGCPAVADPGADLVAVAQRRGYRVMPLVGPSSILMSLMASGFNGQSFAFNGYLPVSGGDRTRAMRQMEQQIRQRRQTQIFIETPYRGDRLVGELAHTLSPSLLLCVAIDITGPNQKIITKSLAEWAKNPVTIGKTPAIFLLYQ
jgi:16S rRNA (cytidine1402-2'-O)-methyltransferase